MNQISPELGTPSKLATNAEAPLVVALVGPTASGKTALALEIAEHFQLEILNIDSRQLYRPATISLAEALPPFISTAKFILSGIKALFNVW